jgi:5-methyltetrahydropteroyltriglutamate--homocysteine methyltransferase
MPALTCALGWHDFYNNLLRMMLDLAKLLRHNFRLLAAAGCKNIQIDEPLFTMFDDEEVAAAVAAINSALEVLPNDIHVSEHFCQGSFAVSKEYDAQIGHRYFDAGRYKAALVSTIECSSYMVKYGMASHYEGLLGNQQLNVGAVDVRDPKTETGEVVADHIRSCRWLVPEQTTVTASCGFSHLSRRTAFGKLRALAEAKRILGG